MLTDYLKTLPQYLLPKQTLTHLAGLLANVKAPAVKNRLIHLFIEKYKVDMSEAVEENPENYENFNAFFIRHLKPELRPLENADILSPVDGSISELGMIKNEQIIQAKGHSYTVSELLACDEGVSEQFIQGSFVTFYLSPKDYHRIHMPMDAELINMIYVPGKLFSVQPATVRVIPRLFARNERLVVFFSTEKGLMAMVLVGATIVGAIGTRWQGDITRSNEKRFFDFGGSTIFAKQGEEMGYFKLGSTVVLLYSAEHQVRWCEKLQAGSTIHYGQTLGNILSH